MDPSLLLLLFVVALAVPLFLTSRRQRRAMREAQEIQNSLVEGDRVMTTSGMHATVVGLGEDTLELEISPGVTTTWVRQAIREKLTDPDEEEASGDATGDADLAPSAEDNVRSDRS
ncbi:MAG: preprotein translocase subunit YajC [Pseudonocardiaceae bacterium]|nr:preprotein translocase subunit YajC [Pseudonocardiaceae bacterium]